MRISLREKSVVVAVFLLVLFSSARGSVEPGASIKVSCDYDSSFTDIAVRVSGYQLITSSAGDFSAIGISNFTDLFTNILYVVVVDSGTTSRVAGFPVFTPSMSSSSSWESVLATGAWQGFVSEIGAMGMSGGAPVEILIRATLPGGYTLSKLDTNMCYTQVGTDFWDDGLSTLAGTHQAIRSFCGSSPVEFHGHSESSTFFSDLDNLILTSVETSDEALSSLKMFPSPARRNLNFVSEYRISRVEILNLNGQVLKWQGFRNVRHALLSLDLPVGLYLAKVETDKGIYTRRLVVTE